MKKFALSCLVLAFSASSAMAQHYIENLNRGAVAMSAGRAGMAISWRSLITDDPNLGFNIYRNGTKITSTPVTNSTFYTDSKGTIAKTYEIRAVLNGEEIETAPVMSWNSAQTLTLDLPAEGVNPAGESYTYTPNDCSVGDVDGDGSYELFVKWDPTNSKDNSQSGYTGNVYLDCYKLDGTKLWRIDLGPNIRAGAHYTQFMVYDFDGNGKAELICKTGPGSIDGTGAYVNQVATLDEIKAADNTKDWRNSNGRIDGGQEWLTVFNGETGAAIHTVYYNPNRNTTLGGDAAGTFNWDDRSGKSDYASYGNRGERYLACVAHLGGMNQRPSAVMCRGYYTYAFLWAVDFDGEHLSTRWFHSSKSKTQYTVTDAAGVVTTYTPDAPTGKTSGSRTAYANGNHNLSLADVDNDGKDEIIWGACAIDDDGTLLYATGFGHGDAMHVGKMIPSRQGVQVYTVHEESPYGWDLHDAATGEVIFSDTASGDTGRGLAADIDGEDEGWEMWCSADGYPKNAVSGLKTVSGTPSQNFRIYWDGDLQDELLDGASITKWDGSAITSLATLTGSSCNSTKKTPNLSADILGDWREEVILWDSSNPAVIYIHSTITASDHRVPCLMQDHQYRMSICWQNVAYNQPPHIGYYLPNGPETSSVAPTITDPASNYTVYSAVSGIKVGEGEGSIANALSSVRPGIYVVRWNNGKAEKIIKM